MPKDAVRRVFRKQGLPTAFHDPQLLNTACNAASKSLPLGYAVHPPVCLSAYRHNQTSQRKVVHLLM
jgi:hypothetical protein